MVRSVRRAVLALCAASGLGVLVAAGPTPPLADLALVDDNPVELGRIRWRRGYTAAATEARATGRPLLVLFDEVPGCATVRAFGEGALSHPLLADAAEALFVPVFVSNNQPGPDQEVLAQFGEPAWNNPAVRFLDAAGQAVAPRLYGDWTAAALAEGMVAALGTRAPPWLQLVAEEERARVAGADTLRFGMHCFWQGEAAFGAVDGVVATRTGFAGGGEAVELTVHPERLDRAGLEAAARAVGARAVTGELRGSPRDDLHALRGTVWARVAMTSAQAARVNAAVAAGRDPSAWLSPRQRAAAAAIAADPGRGWPDAGRDVAAWLAAVARTAG
jgi:hypothetical protein